MAMGIGRGMLAPLVFLIFAMTVIELALAGWAVNRLIDQKGVAGRFPCSWPVAGTSESFLKCPTRLQLY